MKNQNEKASWSEVRAAVFAPVTFAQIKWAVKELFRPLSIENLGWAARNIFRLGPIHRELFATKPKSKLEWINRAIEIAIYLCVVVLGAHWLRSMQ